MKLLIELSEGEIIWTIVMGRSVHVKVWIHCFISDMEGNNKWLGHYSSSNSGIKCPDRDCHCGFEQ